MTNEYQNTQPVDELSSFDPNTESKNEYINPYTFVEEINRVNFFVEDRLATLQSLVDGMDARSYGLALGLDKDRYNQYIGEIKAYKEVLRKLHE